MINRRAPDWVFNKTQLKATTTFEEFVVKLKVAKEYYGELTAENINQHYALQTSHCGQLAGVQYDMELKIE